MNGDQQQTTNGAAKPKRGRPRKHADLELVEKLSHIQCTQAEIASTLGVSVDTLQRHKDFAATFKRGAEGGRKSLRRMQFESANKGNVAMLIWLGKQYLGQRENGMIEVTPRLSLGDLSSAQLRALLEGYARDVPEVLEHVKRDFPEILERMNALDADYSVVPPTKRPALPIAPNSYSTRSDK